MRRLTVLAALAAFCRPAPAADPDQLKALAQTRQWFALRDAVRKMQNPPLLYRGAVACAFHDEEECQRDMRRVIQSGPADARADAYGFLMMQDALAGHFSRARSDSEERLKMSGTSSAPDSLHAVFSAFGQYEGMTVVSQQPSRVHGEYAADHLLIPATINGASARYLVDTGANFSMITESEARRLALKITEVRASNLGDATGKGFTLGRVAMADRLDIGNIRLKNVPFMVVSDDLAAFTELPADARGAIGIQVLAACRAIHFNRTGTIELGGRAEKADMSRANLCFDGLQLLVEGSFRGSRLTFVLDTGDSESRLYPRFEREFADLVKERGVPDIWTVSGAGGTVEAQVTMLPELVLDLGGMRTALQRVHIWDKGAGTDLQHGVIGLDALNQAREVTLDFQAMRMTLTPK